MRSVASGEPCRKAVRSCSTGCARRSPWRRNRRRMISGVPLAGGLVGYAAYDVVRHFERLPARSTRLEWRSRAALRGAALGAGVRSPHARYRARARRLGEGAPLAARRKSCAPCAARCRRRGDRDAMQPPWPPSRARDYLAGVRRTQEYIAAGDVYQLVLASRFSGRHELDPFQAYRALRLINPSPYMYYCALGEVAVVGSSPEALVKLNGPRGAAAAHRRYAPACGGRSRRSGACRRAARRSEGERRACHAGGSGAQRSRARRACRQRARRAVPLDRALQSRHAHGEWRARRACAGQGRLRPVCRGLPGRDAGGRAEGARDADHR